MSLVIPKPGYYILSSAPTVGLVEGAPVRILEHKGHYYAVGAFDPGYPVKFLLTLGVTFTKLYTEEEMQDELTKKVPPSVPTSAERLDGGHAPSSHKEQSHRRREWDWVAEEKGSEPSSGPELGSHPKSTNTTE